MKMLLEMIEKFQVIILNMKEIKKYSNPFKMIYTKTITLRHQTY